MEWLTMPVTPAAEIQLPLLAPLGTTIRFTSPHPDNFFFFFKNTNKVLVLFQYFLCCILQTHLKKKNLYPSYFWLRPFVSIPSANPLQLSSVLTIRLMCKGCVVHREWCFCDSQIKILNVLHTKRKAKYWCPLVSFPHVNMPETGCRRWEWFSKRCVLSTDFLGKHLSLRKKAAPHSFGS